MSEIYHCMKFLQNTELFQLYEFLFTLEFLGHSSDFTFCFDVILRRFLFDVFLDDYR